VYKKSIAKKKKTGKNPSESALNLLSISATILWNGVKQNRLIGILVQWRGW